MRRTPLRFGVANKLYVLMIGSAAIVVVLSWLLFGPSFNDQVDPFRTSRGRETSQTIDRHSEPHAERTGDLFMYCAAGMRYPMEPIVAEYQQEFGASVQLQYGGSNTLLNQLEVSKTGDLYLAGDDSYIQLAREKGLVVESIPIAKMAPVIVVRRDSKKGITSIEHLLGETVKVALGDAGAAAIGKKVKRLLSASGHWTDLEKHTTSRGVFKPTVNDVANAVKLGSVDAGIVWDSTAAQYPELKSIRVPELDAGAALVEIGIISTSKRPTAALHLARYVSSRDRGQKVFAAQGWEVIDGDVWADRPEITFFAGAVNRRALEPIIKKFERREGVTINSVYNGCGILTAQMRTMNRDQASGFPDTYMACDVYYLNTVQELFQDAVNVSDTDIVIAVKKGNPKEIKGPEDLLREDVRLVLGHPEQCTIGVLSKRLLQDEGLYEQLMNDKDVPMKPTSAMLIPDVITGAADAVLAYRTDTRAESNRVDVVSLTSPLSKAIQPYSIARSSAHKYLARRLFDTIAHSRDSFEAAGFNWRLDMTR